MSLRAFNSIGELVDFIQTGTGVETWFEETGKTTSDYIVIYLLNSKIFNANNKAYDSNLRMQVSFFTKEKFNVLAIDNFMRTEFGSSCEISFQAEGERKQAIYEIEVCING